MPGKAVISLTTGLEDSEKVTVALLVAVGAAESGRPTLIFLTKEAVRLAIPGTAIRRRVTGRIGLEGVGTALAAKGVVPVGEVTSVLGGLRIDGHALHWVRFPCSTGLLEAGLFRREAGRVGVEAFPAPV
jgi:hypothetical protein